MSIIMVRSPDTTYGVSVRPGLIRGAGEVIRELSPRKKCSIVTDSNVAPLYLDALQASLAAHGFECVSVVLEAGEQHKNLGAVSKIYDVLLGARVERSTPLIALGGGVVGDIAGFAAATILRGVPFVQIPTTLLAMVDASVGGKTGVNHERGKNLIGAFHQPIAVLADVEALVTLPKRELVSGLAECIKHDVIADGDWFNRFERSVDQLLACDTNALQHLVAHNVLVKSRIVEQDPYEHGVRAHLNFGHTFAHAIEKLTHYTIPHGECVAMGIVAACELARRLSMISGHERDRVRNLLERTGLPTRWPALDLHALIETMRSDKKVSDAKLRFVLPETIGRVVLRDDVEESLVEETVRALMP